MTAIPQGSTIGILGGGQLGRMTAMAARSMGYRVQVMDPDPSCPARFVVDACFVGSWDDARAAGDLARGSDVITLEIEQISIASLEAAERHAPVRPGKEILHMVQDRIRQKDWLRGHGFPLGNYRPIYSEADLASAIAELGERIFLKRAYGGYDGRGQVKMNRREDAAPAWHSLGEAPCVAEQAFDLQAEISVMVARNPSGQILAYPAATNHHEQQILVWSALPSLLPAGMEKQAQDLATTMAHQLKLEGLLAVEMFVTAGDGLYVNELAPRPHNSYHASQRCCVTSQFEQAVRAICDLPLGDASIMRPAAIANLLGDLWLKEDPDFARALSVPEVSVHLYEKHTARAGRKMGHLSATADTARQAVARVLQARNLL
ncbi:MAG: 5-(carboxyamino)imidazole ribonucleotide synthase [Acidobacteriaceae bacterium]